MLKKSSVERLREIQSEFNDLIQESKNILREESNRNLEENKIHRDRAESYWLAHIDHAVNGHNRHDTSLESELNSWEELELEEDEDEDDFEEPLTEDGIFEHEEK